MGRVPRSCLPPPRRLHQLHSDPRRCRFYGRRHRTKVVRVARSGLQAPRLAVPIGRGAQGRRASRRCLSRSSLPLVPTTYCVHSTVVSPTAHCPLPSSYREGNYDRLMVACTTCAAPSSALSRLYHSSSIRNTTHHHDPDCDPRPASVCASLFPRSRLASTGLNRRDDSPVSQLAQYRYLRAVGKPTNLRQHY